MDRGKSIHTHSSSSPTLSRHPTQAIAECRLLVNRRKKIKQNKTRKQIVSSNAIIAAQLTTSSSQNQQRPRRPNRPRLRRPRLQHRNQLRLQRHRRHRPRLRPHLKVPRSQNHHHQSRRRLLRRNRPPRPNRHQRPRRSRHPRRQRRLDALLRFRGPGRPLRRRVGQVLAHQRPGRQEFDCERYADF